MRRRSVSIRLVLALLLAALCVSLVPLLLLARCDVPCADDFSYGEAVHAAVRSGAGLSGALRAAVGQAAAFYRSWQGSFAASFLMALQPAAFSERLYALTPLFVIGMLSLGCFAFSLRVFPELFGLPRAHALCAGALLLLLWLQLLPSPVQGLYWYNGSVYYGVFFSLMLLGVALGVSAARRGGLGRLALLCALSFALGGGNYVTALCAALLYAGALLLALLLRHPARARLPLPFLCLLCAFALSAAAPGNAVRQASVQHSPDALSAVALSFVCAAESFADFFSLPLAGALAFLALLFSSAAPERRFAFRLPGLFSLFSFCLYAAHYTPTLYALGGDGDGRLRDLFYYTFVLLLALNLLYWLGWLRRRRGAAESGGERLDLRALLAVCLLCLVCCGGHIASGRGFTSLMALGSLRSGEAAAYRACAERRFAVLSDPAVSDAVLEPYPCTPYLLYFDDVTPQADDWRNQAVSVYYGKNSVVLQSD